MINAVTEGSFEVEFEQAGFIYNLQGTSRQTEQYKGNQIHIVGSDTIRDLLGIPSDDESRVVEFISPEPPVMPSESLPRSNSPSKATDKRFVEIKKFNHDSVPDANEGKKRQSAKPVESEPSTKQAEVEKSAEPGLRVLLGKNLDTKKDIYWNPLLKHLKNLQTNIF